MNYHRFHLLAEFDEGKRSCRRRLAGHNRRRRKTQPQDVPSGLVLPGNRENSGGGNLDIVNLLTALARLQGFCYIFFELFLLLKNMRTKAVFL